MGLNLIKPEKLDPMSHYRGRKFPPQFKAQVALETLQEKETVTFPHYLIRP